MTKFAKEVAAGNIPGLTIDPDHPMLSVEAMDIYSPPGTRVKYLGFNGHDNDKEQGDKFLTAGQIYTIKETVVGGWHTDVYLEEVGGQGFNSVMFGAVEDE